MKNFEITTMIIEKAISELSDSERRLVDIAREATYRAYAPYSDFKVGAAIELSNGEIVSGNNQENAAFPSGLCAERTAAFYAHSTSPDAYFKSIAIAARGGNNEFIAEPISPCGACRQVLLEYEKIGGEDVKVYLAGKDKVYIVPSVKSILPLAFSEIE